MGGWNIYRVATRIEIASQVTIRYKESETEIFLRIPSVFFPKIV